MAGEQSFTVKKTISGPGPTVGGIDAVIPADGNKGFQKTIAANTVDGRITLDLDISTIQVIGIEANQDCDVYTNAIHSGSPDDHLVLKANKPLLWNINDPAGMLFLTVDVTDLYVTTGSNDTILKLICGLDETPVL